MNFKFCLILDIVDGAQFEENVSRELDYIQDHVIETQQKRISQKGLKVAKEDQMADGHNG